MTYYPSTIESIITTMLEEAPHWLGEDAIAELLPSLTTLFVQEAPNILARIITAVHVGNMQEIYDAAHYLKGSSSSLGLVTIAQLCNELEKASEQHDMTAAATLASQLMSEYGQVEKALLSLTPSFNPLPL